MTESLLEKVNNWLSLGGTKWSCDCWSEDAIDVFALWVYVEIECWLLKNVGSIYPLFCSGQIQVYCFV